MLNHALCAVLAPALASAAAFPWALPEPTFAIPAIDSWSPAPTQAPNVELFRRADDDSICGWISASSASPLACYNSEDSCATNTYFGVHGCCNTKDMSACTIPTTCIPSSLMSSSCTDSQCKSNSYIAKCTGTAAPECVEWHFVYSTAKTTTLTEYGCSAKATTAMIERTYSGQSISVSSSDVQQSGSASSQTEGSGPAATSSTSPIPLAAATQAPSKPNNTGVIVGGAVGGVVALGAIATVIIWLILRDRRQKREAAAHQSWLSAQSGPVPGVTEYNPDGFPTSIGTAWQEPIGKTTWKTGTSAKSPIVSDCGSPDAMAHEPGATIFGVVETGGTPVHEMPARWQG